MRQKVVFIADSLDNAYRFQQVLSAMDIEIAAGSTLQVKKLLAPGSTCDLVIFEARGQAMESLPDVLAGAREHGCPLLAIVDEADAERMVAAGFAGDFIVNGAGLPECSARVRRLLGGSKPGTSGDIVTVGPMVINLATYQVSVGGDPIDFTYLEYALLSFLVCHPGRTFSRDELLRHVWGFDYYGGSRTVDVHVRRIRAKLGPDLAQHLETVRGVGYLWSA